MLTSFFRKSTPLNFIVVAVYILVFYYSTVFGEYNSPGFLTLLEETGILLLLIFSMIVLNFIAKRNELTQRNAYKIVLFASFSAMLVAVLENNAVIIANIFILLALRRIISLRSQIHVQQKIFDATFWICIASLFYFWSILFIVLVFFGILLYVNQNYKNWLIPFIAFLTVLSLTTTIHLLITNTFFTFSEWFQESNFDFSSYKELSHFIPLVVLAIIALWSCFFYVGVIRKASANLKASHSLILIAAFIALVVAFFSPIKNTSELLFFMAPLAIIVTNYLQVIESKWVKEILLVGIVILPFLLMLLF